MTGAVAFASAAEAWFWTMQALTARSDGARPNHARTRTPRPGEPDDVVRELDRLYRRRRLDLEHVRVLRLYGERETQPDPKNPREAAHARLWREAMERLEAPLRAKGMLA